MASPSIDAALRVAAAQASGIEPNPDDVRIGKYGPDPEPNLAQTVGYQPQLTYDDYLQWMNRSNLPIQPASGAHYSAPGAMHGYMNYGLPPTIQQRSPYATAAYRSYVDPFGQMMVQPLVGFPSAYPHVLSGVPMNMNYGLEWAMGGVPLGQGLGVFPVPSGQPPAAPQPQKTTAPRNTGNGTPKKQVETPPAAQIPPPLMVPPHVRYEGTATPYANWTPEQLQPQVQAPASAAPMRSPYGILYNTGSNAVPPQGVPGVLPGSGRRAEGRNIIDILGGLFSAPVRPYNPYGMVYGNR